MVKPAERKWLVFFALAVIVVTTIPYFIAYSRQGADWRFTGFVFGAEDGNSYIAKMRAGMSGDWLFRTPYTPFPQTGTVALFSYLLLGKVVGGPGAHEQMVALIHLFRFAGILLFVFASYDFLALFIRRTSRRRLALVLISFGGGLGWLSVLGLASLWGNGLPLEFYSPETFGFLMVYGLPHLACARAFLLLGMRDYLCRAALIPGTSYMDERVVLTGRKPGLPGSFSGRNAVKPQWWIRAKTLLIWLVVWLMQPLSIITVWGVIAAHVVSTGLWKLWRARKSRSADWETWCSVFNSALWTGLISAPPVVYTFLSFRLDPFLRLWERQNIFTSLPLLNYFLAFAVILPLALLRSRALLKEQPWQVLLLVGWVLIFPLLAYAPLTIQRRLVEGVWVALVVLAVLWIEHPDGPLRRWPGPWLSLAYISSIILVLGGIISVWRPGLPLYRPAEEVRAFAFLSELGDRNLVVLGTHETSNAIPAWATVKTVVGHGPESLREPEYLEKTKRFFDPDTLDMERADFLREIGVTHVFWGPQERALGGWNPKEAAFLRFVYQEGPYSIFQVQPEELP